VNDRLVKADPHYWEPVGPVYRWLNKLLTPEMRVLEIGPGTAPFKRADVYVDFVPIKGLNVVQCDIATEPLPFADKSFDFIICRHVLEDMYNPFPICAEMSRVGHAGYIETPSPIAELCRGVDGGDPKYRGYHHHRFICWGDNGLKLISKYPIVEYLEFDGLADRLKDQRYWNTYHIWIDEVKVKHVQSPLDYDIPRQYPAILKAAIERSVKATDAFWGKIA
jgi:hypothetical protein